MNDDLILLASAYLDDDLSADDRARVDGDPELLAEVERMRRVRAALADVDPPSPAAREWAIAAALAAAPPQAPPVASLDARRRARWVAPVAAAAVGVLAVGAVIAGLRTGGDDEAADGADATEEVAEGGGSADTLGAGEVLNDDGVGRTADQAPEDEADVGEGPPAADTQLSSDATAAAGTTVAASGATTGAPATSAAGTTATAGTGGVGLPLLRSERQLLAFAEDGSVNRYVEAPEEVEGTADAAGCDLGEVVGVAVYRLDGDDIVVDVVRDADEVLAVDPVHCAVIASVDAG